MDEQKLLVDVEEAAARLAIGRTWLRLLIGTGAIAAVRVGRSVRIPVAELDRWVRERTEEARPTLAAAVPHRSTSPGDPEPDDGHV